MHVFVGALIVIAVIVGMTLWTGEGARTAADDAGDKVSEFYLQELAGRRSQAVAELIGTEFKQMERAVDLMMPEDLASEDSLRAFIGRVETLCDLDLFAVVDEDDVVYARYATYMGGSRYEFLQEGRELSGRLVSTTSLYGASKQVCLAVPVYDRTFMGKKLKACFVQVDIDDIISTLTYNDEDGGETSCCIYYKNGENLTQMGFGPIGANENLLNALRGQVDVSEWRRVQESFDRGRQGEVRFAYKGATETLYYMPVEDTSWMLAILISDSLIRDQIRSVSDGMLAQSTIQILVTSIVLLVYFGMLVFRMRRVSITMLEKEREQSRNVGERAERSEQELGVIKEIAYRDALTGVKSKYAYTEEEPAIDEAMRDGSIGEIGVLVCDVNNLKYVNDTYGHSAGDEYIKAACKLVCNLYDHSPVFRIGGDEFAVILRGEDYAHRHEILAELNRIVEENNARGEVVVAAGMAEYEPGDARLRDVFRRADQRMYERKALLKQLQGANQGPR